MKAKLAGVDKMIGAHPASWWKTPAFYRADGRPVFPIGGGAPDEDDDDDGADDGGDDGGDDLDDEINDAVGDDDDGDDDDAELTPAEKRLAARLEKQLDSKLEKVGQSIADRLVNAQATAAKKAARARAAANGGGKPADKTAAVDDRTADIRDARATYREMVVGEITFASNVEREAGMKLAAAVVTKAVQSGVDPDEAGKQAAQEVAATITAIRKDARKQLLVQLKKEGRLVQKEKPEGGGAGSGGGIGTQATRVATGASAKTDMQKGAEAAARIRPSAKANQ